MDVRRLISSLAAVRPQLIAVLAIGMLTGCGSTKSRTATEQLLMSDAVDRAVAQISFASLAGQKVFFDTKFIVNSKDPLYIQAQRGMGFVTSEYLISSLRQQMVAANLLLQDKIEDADYVVEARVGAVGFDSNEIIYGIPASAPLSNAASAMFTNVPIPSIPEISVARKNVQSGAAKVGVFAYDRRTREPVWQAGISQATSDARDSWVMGIGPFQYGTIYKGTRFAGAEFRPPHLVPLPPLDPTQEFTTEEPQVLDPVSSYTEQRTFHRLDEMKRPSEIRPVSADAPVAEPNAFPVTPAAPITAPDAVPMPVGTVAGSPSGTSQLAPSVAIGSSTKESPNKDSPASEPTPDNSAIIPGKDSPKP